MATSDETACPDLPVASIAIFTALSMNENMFHVACGLQFVVLRMVGGIEEVSKVEIDHSLLAES